MSYIAKFMAKRILNDLEDYNEVIKARPDLKDDIDKYISDINKLD